MCKTDALPTELRTLGGARGNRTHDLLVANQSLSLLSYSPKNVTPLFTLGGVYQNLVGIVGFEPTAPASQTQCSDQTELNPVNMVLPLGDKGGAEPQVIMPLGQLHRKTHRLHL